jgi:hypothetical protein
MRLALRSIALPQKERGFYSYSDSLLGNALRLRFERKPHTGVKSSEIWLLLKSSCTSSVEKAFYVNYDS